VFPVPNHGETEAHYPQSVMSVFRTPSTTWGFWLVLLLVCHAPIDVHSVTVEQHSDYQTCLQVANRATCTSLQLHSSSLTGTIPTEIGLLTELMSLYLHENPGLTGTIPTEFGRLTKMGSLAFGVNPGLTGTIPTELGRLTAMTGFYMQRSDLSGTIPTEFAQLTAINNFYVQNNTGLCGPLVSVGTLGTSYNEGTIGTNLGNTCPPPSPPSPPPPPPPSPPTAAPTSSPTNPATATPTSSPTATPTSSPTATRSPTWSLPCCEKLRENPIFCCMEARNPALMLSTCQECGTWYTGK